MVDEFVQAEERREDGRSTSLPAMKDILEETYGVIVYQEQVMQIAPRSRGFTLTEADLLRKAMGKKKPR